MGCSSSRGRGSNKNDVIAEETTVSARDTSSSFEKQSTATASGERQQFMLRTQSSRNVLILKASSDPPDSDSSTPSTSNIQIDVQQENGPPTEGSPKNQGLSRTSLPFERIQSKSNIIIPVAKSMEVTCLTDQAPKYKNKFMNSIELENFSRSSISSLLRDKKKGKKIVLNLSKPLPIPI